MALKRSDTLSQEAANAVHVVIDNAVADLRALGLDGVKAWRALCGVSLIALREEQCPFHGREDMRYVHREVDRHLAEIAKAEGHIH